MSKIIAASLQLNGGPAEQSVKSFKAQLREANQELVAATEKFGAMSKEAINAAKKTAALKDAIGDARTLTDAFNPDAKFKAFGQSLQAISGGFSAITGTLALFGSQSEQVEKSLLKVQAAMAISQGLNSIMEAKDVFKSLGAQIKSLAAVQAIWNFVQTGSFKAQKEATAATTVQTTATEAQAAATTASTVATTGASAAMKVFRMALIATGIGAIVVGLGLLISNFDKIKPVIEKVIGPLKNVSDFIGNIINSVTDFMGITSEAGRKMDKMVSDLETSIKRQEKYLELNADKYDQFTQRKLRASLDYHKKEAELLKDTTISQQERDSLMLQLKGKFNREIARADKDRHDAEMKLQADAGKEQDRLATQRREKANQAKEARLQAEKEANNQLRTLQQENYLATITDDRKQAEEKIRIDLENNVKQIESLNVNGAIKADLIKENEKKAQIALAQVKTEFDKKDEDAKKAKDEKALKDVQDAYAKMHDTIKQEEQKISNALKQDVLDGTISPEDAAAKELEIKRAALQAAYDLEAQFGRDTSVLKGQLLDFDIAAKKNAVEQTKAFDAAEKESKMRLYEAIGSAFGALSGLLGQQTKAGKAAALAEIAINTGVGFIKALRIAQNSAEAAGPGAAFAFPIFYATQVAAVLAAASRAKAILSTAGGSGGGMPTPSMPTLNVAAPLKSEPPQVTNTRLPQDQINQISNATVRAFVVEADMQNASQRIARLSRAARLGGVWILPIISVTAAFI